MGKGLGFRVSGLGFSSTLQCPDPSSSLVVLDGEHVYVKSQLHLLGFVLAFRALHPETPY